MGIVLKFPLGEINEIVIAPNYLKYSIHEEEELGSVKIRSLIDFRVEMQKRLTELKSVVGSYLKNLA